MARRGELRPGELYLARTRSGKYRHLTDFPGGVTLCGHLVQALERNWQTKKPIAYAPHWDEPDPYDVLTTGESHGTCEHCTAIRRRRERRG